MWVGCNFSPTHSSMEKLAKLLEKSATTHWSELPWLHKDLLVDQNGKSLSLLDNWMLWLQCFAHQQTTDTELGHLPGRYLRTRLKKYCRWMEIKRAWCLDLLGDKNNCMYFNPRDNPCEWVANIFFFHQQQHGEAGQAAGEAFGSHRGMKDHCYLISKREREAEVQ